MTCTATAATPLRRRSMTHLAAGTLLVLLASAAAYGENPRAKRTDRYGDPLPPGAVARLGTARLRHGYAKVTFSKDGKRLISLGSDGEVRVWEAASGKLVRRKRLRSFGTVALSPGGATVATWDLSTVKVYDAATGKVRRRLPANFGRPVLKFSLDGKVLAGA